MCAIYKSPIPDWAASTVIEGADDYVASGDLNSWNDLFGKPRQRSEALSGGGIFREEVWGRIMHLHTLRRAHQ